MPGHRTGSKIIAQQRKPLMWLMLDHANCKKKRKKTTSPDEI
jgi:hypothetical protein